MTASMTGGEEVFLNVVNGEDLSFVGRLLASAGAGATELRIYLTREEVVRPWWRWGARPAEFICVEVDGATAVRHARCTYADDIEKFFGWSGAAKRLYAALGETGVRLHCDPHWND